MDVKFRNKISVNDYLKLRESAGWQNISARQARAGLRNSAYVLAAIYKGETIGMVRIISDGGYVALIVDFAVLPEFRGKGVGSRMMEILMERVHDGIRDGEGVSVQLMAAKGRENFYRRFGFMERPYGKFGPGMSQWIQDTGGE